jgi:hypothetical protein
MESGYRRRDGGLILLNADPRFGIRSFGCKELILIGVDAHGIARHAR